MNPCPECQNCGARLPGQAIGDLCANCLLKLALDSSVDRGVSAAAAGETSTRSLGGYELLEVIGRGGMGMVYKARQKHLNRMVALKMIHNGREASPDTVVRFRIEAEAAAKLDHPHIVPTYEIGELNGQPFFSMKLIVGLSLGKRCAELALPNPAGGKGGSQRSVREAQVRIAALLAKVARAVHFAHQHGIIHRDLKPNNILIDAEGEPHLTDFGIAKLTERDLGLTGTNDVLGTPAYMAPEQAAGKSVSSAADIYSLGAILYELLAGRPPFRGETPLDTLRKALEEEPVFPTTINITADKELAAICLKCLEKNPAQRYGSALGLAEDLERWIRYEPVQARRAGRVARTFRWTRRNPVGASLIASLCAGLAGALVLLSMVSAEKNKTAAILGEAERSDESNKQLVSLMAGLILEELEGLWLRNDRRMLHISSEHLSAVSGLPIRHVPKKSAIERFSFALAANENAVSDARKYAPLLRQIEERLSARRGQPVRIDLKIFKFKEDRAYALVTNEVDFARMGDVYFLRTQQRHPGMRALVMADTDMKTNVFFTRTDTGIRTLADLKGRSVAFGDPVAGITFWGQMRLAEAGLSGKDLKEFVCLDSRSEFMEEVHELGYDAALKRRGWLHSTADVIEEVINGRFDAGVTSLRGFQRHRHRGLVMISGSEFERTQNPWVAGTRLSPEAARDLTEALTSIKDEVSLALVPGSPSAFTPATEASFSKARSAMKRMEGLFPLQSKPAAIGGGE